MGSYLRTAEVEVGGRIRNTDEKLEFPVFDQITNQKNNRTQWQQTFRELSLTSSGFFPLVNLGTALGPGVSVHSLSQAAEDAAAPATGRQGGGTFSTSSRTTDSGNKNSHGLIKDERSVLYNKEIHLFYSSSSFMCFFFL